MATENGQLLSDKPTHSKPPITKHPPEPKPPLNRMFPTPCSRPLPPQSSILYDRIPYTQHGKPSKARPHAANRNPRRVHQKIASRGPLNRVAHSPIPQQNQEDRQMSHRQEKFRIEITAPSVDSETAASPLARPSWKASPAHRAVAPQALSDRRAVVSDAPVSNAAVADASRSTLRS